METSLEFITPDLIKERPRAWRTHSAEQLKSAIASVRQYGIVQPVLLDSQNQIVCGTLILDAAKELRLNTIPIIRVDRLTDDELRLYAVTAQKLADQGGYDENLLAEELDEVLARVGDFDLEALAIPQAELDRLFGNDALAATDDDQDFAANQGPDISQLGDLWEIGPHRLLHGDSLCSTSYEALMGGEKAAFVLSDVPFNLPANAISGLGKHKHQDFIQAAGELSPNEFTRFLTQAMRLIAEHSRDGALVAIFMGYQFLLELLRAGNVVFGRPKAMCTWVKNHGGMSALYRSQTEYIVFFKHGTAPHTNNIMLGKHGRNRTTAWNYAGMNSFSPERDELLSLHPTPKPVPLLQDAILDVTRKGDIVLDPFAGSGSLILAAEAAGRRAYTIELDGKYVDGSLRRISKALGIDPKRDSDGMSFSALTQLKMEATDE